MPENDLSKDINESIVIAKDKIGFETETSLLFKLSDICLISAGHLESKQFQLIKGKRLLIQFRPVLKVTLFLLLCVTGVLV